MGGEFRKERLGTKPFTFLVELDHVVDWVLEREIRRDRITRQIRVAGVVNRHREQTSCGEDLRYVPAPGQDEVERERAKIANEALLMSLLATTYDNATPPDASETPQEPRRATEAPDPVVSPLPPQNAVGNATRGIYAEAKWCADLALFCAVFAGVVVFVAALADPRLGLALSAVCWWPVHLAAREGRQLRQWRG